MHLTLLTPPAVEPLTIEEVKSDRRMNPAGTTDDAYLAGLIVTAREYLDGDAGILGRALISQQWEGTLDGFFTFEIEMPLPPLISIDEIVYLDANGVEQTLPATEYQINRRGKRPALLKPKPGKVWPVTQLDAYNAVTIRFTAGYGDDWNAVPRPIRQAMCLLIGDMFELREETITGTIIANRKAVDSLLASYRVRAR